jgi:hypothetical protein
MAVRPFTFGARLCEKGRSLRIHAPHGSEGHFVVEDEREGEETRRRVHESLGEAVKGTATTWRNRLH